ncbi:VOC family protein [Sphingomonas gilva]|uniref:VOC family protein n=1 Tax=Sphingomonas gilva TaxID=2305907 RepID=A0A396RQT6_9SPHN|nr:VOC family protein [Sphingomonas gilva]RHW18997.1 VOC family protein [Sphingomonas gilva]
MLDHITFGVADFVRSIRFYDRAFAPLGVRRLFDMVDGEVPVAGYGDTRPWFWIAHNDPTQGKLHVAVGAANREMVDAFHREALLAGGEDNGAPGLRPHYHPGYYGAFVRDPDGHNIEAVFHGTS